MMLIHAPDDSDHHDAHTCIRRMSDYKFGDITKRLIRDMTGNKDYEFGDGTKAVSAATQEAAEKAAAAVINAGGTASEAGAAAKKALDDSGYQFGDLTKAGIR